DRDLKQLAPCITCPIATFPDALPTLIANFPPGPVLYTGGLENHPNIIAQLASKRPLWGNLPVVLDRVRDPHFIQTIRKADESTPKVIPPGVPSPSRGRWLRKPLRSSGGHGIRFAKTNEGASPSHYFQEFIDGPSLSALYVSTGDEADGDNQTQLLGIAEQLIGQPWLHARPFAYCGNIGPITLPRPVEVAIGGSGLALSHATGLRGLWGLDFILNGDAAYPVEVNPRYTAAIEVLELGAKFRSLMLHHDCFTHSRSLLKKYPRCSTTQVGKAIYYAPHHIVFPISGDWDKDLDVAFDPWRVPNFADIPEPRTVIEIGSPVLTLFAVGSSTAECLKGLQSRAAELDHLFAEATQ
ncbi:MAG TPA: ATP-grasp domain-containing protein, partial [Gemmata sp.]|nr:ATP-grasp domain-containing protein [Gemmata sp.]